VVAVVVATGTVTVMAMATEIAAVMAIVDTAVDRNHSPLFTIVNATVDC
jgi:hypothetical protein